VLGEIALFDGNHRSASVAALEDTIVLAVPRAALLALVQSQPAMLEAVFRLFGTLVRRLTDQTSDHVFLDLPGRVAKALLRLANADAANHAASAPPTAIDVTQGLLAELVGGSRQSVNQAIRKFIARGWVRNEGRLLVLSDVTALRRRAGVRR
jgi:CRP/FNR family cyclic AMP-dependent transcriptional regulator